jgi:hypothetical protein
MLRTSLVACLFASSLLACSTETAVDELAGEDGDGEVGKGDESSATFTFFAVQPDLRACSFDARCGGFFVERPNRSTTICGRGQTAERCYVDGIDWSGTAMPKSIAMDYEQRLRGGEQLLLRGDIVPAANDAGSTLHVKEIWTAGSAQGVVDGVFVMVKDNGIRCFRAPCPSLTETRLNSTRAANIADVDFSVSGASDDIIELAQNALFADGVIVVGDRYYFGGDGKGRTANQFFVKAPVPLF